MTLVIAHRGASGYAPENTVQAFKLAVKMHADGIELDIHQHGQQFYVHHDPQDSPSKAPLLEEALSLPELEGMILFIEIKSIQNPELLNKLLRPFAEKLKLCVQSYELPILEMIKNMPYEIGVIARTAEDPLALLNRYNASHLSLRYNSVTDKLVETMHKNEKKIYCWTVNKREDFAKMKSLNVDGIITNYPDL
ncbi:glycerophosphodiester phosphodiesterase [bacterium]|jgi:glycerophosphoryl diester phosphodiesterase|nr:glycerophosphodiester phosphodiesterase [bacterium]